MCCAMHGASGKTSRGDKPLPTCMSHSLVQGLEDDDIIIPAPRLETKCKIFKFEATTNCANKATFPQATVDPTKTKELRATNGTPINHEGKVHAKTQLTASTPCAGIARNFLDGSHQHHETRHGILLDFWMMQIVRHALFPVIPRGKSCLVSPDGNIVELLRIESGVYPR